MNLSDSDVYRAHADELIRFATGVVGPSDACDVVSAAVLACFSSRQWGSIENKRAYLYRAVLNESRRLYRSSSRRQLREQRVARPEATELAESNPEILEAVGALSTRQRAVIVLTYWADLDPAAIAQLLDITEGSVRKHLARGRARLKEALHAYV